MADIDFSREDFSVGPIADLMWASKQEHCCPGIDDKLKEALQ
jgi:hypothetical protein